MTARDRIERLCNEGLDARSLRVALLGELRALVPFDFYVWLLTDPETSVGSAPLAETPSLADLPRLIRSKYLTTTNRWTTLATNAPQTLAGATDGVLTASHMWTDVLAGYSIDDVMSTVFRDQYGCWGFLDLWRANGAFSTDECAMLQSVAEVVTSALRRSLASTFAHPTSTLDHDSGPAVLLLSDDLELLTQTPHTEAFLRTLLPPEAGRSPVPAAAYNVAGQLLARERGTDHHPPWARVHLRDGVWVTLRAARIANTSALDRASIAVSIEMTPPVERSNLYARVAGFTDRESELLGQLVGGGDTRELAGRLFMSQHTVQDHLKSMFAKTGVNTRRLLVARATGLAG